MKYALGLGLVLVTGSLNSLAETNQNGDLLTLHAGRTIRCTDLTTGADILSFNSTQGQEALATANFNLLVRAHFDEVGEMTLQDLRSGEVLQSVRSEESLQVTLTSIPNTQSETQRAFTRQGFATVRIADVKSQDTASAVSYSRKGESRMEIRLETLENPRSPTAIQCFKVR